MADASPTESTRNAVPKPNAWTTSARTINDAEHMVLDRDAAHHLRPGHAPGGEQAPMLGRQDLNPDRIGHRGTRLRGRL